MKQKGTPKTGGRTKGTPNKVTQEMRDFIRMLLENNQQQIIDDLEKIEPHQRLNILTGLLKYCVPTLQSISTNIDFTKLTDEQLETIINNIKNGN